MNNQETEVITIDATSMELVATQLKDADKPISEIAAQLPITQHLVQLAKQYAGLEVKDAADSEGLARVHEARMELKGKRVAIEKVRKLLNADALDHQRRVNGAAAYLTGLIEPTEELLVKQEENVEAARLEAQRLRLRQEEDRIRAEQEEKLRQEREQLEKETRERQQALDAQAKELREKEDRLAEGERLRLEWERKILEEQEEVKRDRQKLEEDKQQHLAQLTPEVGTPATAADNQEEEHLQPDPEPIDHAMDRLQDQIGAQQPGEEIPVLELGKTAQPGVYYQPPLPAVRQDNSETDVAKLTHRWDLIGRNLEDMEALQSEAAEEVWDKFSRLMRELVAQARRSTGKL